MASKLYGSDPNANPRLFDVIAKAKKSGFAKQSIEAAILRGQGKSASGAALESVVIEGILPGNVGVVVDCESDSRARTLQNLRLVIKRHGGAASPSSYLFQRRGRIVFEPSPGTSLDSVLEQGLEVGALDVEEGGDSDFMVTTEATETSGVAKAMAEALGLQIATSEVVWVPNEDTVVPVPDAAAATAFAKLVDDMHENDPSVRGVYMNISAGDLADDEWQGLLEKVNV